MAPGTRRLVRLSVASPVKAVERQLDPRHAWRSARTRTAPCPRCSTTAPTPRSDALVACAGVDARRFAALRDRVAAVSCRRPSTSWAEWRRCCPLRRKCNFCCPPSRHQRRADAIADVRAQLARLMPPGFVTATGRRTSGRPHPLPDRDPAPPRAAAARHRGRPGADAAGAGRPGRLRRTSAALCRRARESRRRPRHRAADRGVAGEPVGPAARHPPSGQ